MIKFCLLIQDEITLEEAKEREDITISFRQLNKFTFASGTIIFMFFGLVTESYSAGTEIKMLVLKEKYYSLRLNSSDNISGIPDDETLLNSVLTAEAIERGELLDYSLSENKVQDKIPSIFKSQPVK